MRPDEFRASSEETQRRSSGHSWNPATVITYRAFDGRGGIAVIRPDGGSSTLEAANLTGTPLSPLDRVQWVHDPPAGVFVVGVITTTEAGGGCCPIYCFRDSDTGNTGEGFTSISFGTFNFTLDDDATVQLVVTWYCDETSATGGETFPAMNCIGTVQVDGTYNSDQVQQQTMRRDGDFIAHMHASLSWTGAITLSAGAHTIDAFLSVAGQDIAFNAGVFVTVNVGGVTDDTCLNQAG